MNVDLGQTKLPKNQSNKINLNYFANSVGTVGIFNALPDPVLMGEMSKIVGEDEQGN